MVSINMNAVEKQNLSIKDKYNLISRQSNRCIVICGPSGSGKTMSINHMVNKYGYNYIPFVTTRALRAEELNTGSESISRKEFMDRKLNNKVFLGANNYGNSYGYDIDGVYRKLIEGETLILESPSSQLLTDVHVLLPKATVLGFVTLDHSITMSILSDRNDKLDIDTQLRTLQSSIEVFNIELAQKSMSIIQIRPKLGNPQETIDQIDKAISNNIS